MLQEITPAEIASPEINSRAATTPHSGQELLRSSSREHWDASKKFVSASRFVRQMSPGHAAHNAAQSAKAMRAATKASNLSYDSHDLMSVLRPAMQGVMSRFVLVPWAVVTFLSILIEVVELLGAEERLPGTIPTAG